MKKKTILILLAVLFISCLGWFYYQFRQEEFMPSKSSGKVIKLGTTDKPVFMRAKVWGIAGNHEEIVLSESAETVTNKSVDYVFYTSEVYYKVDEVGVITLFAPESSISEPINKFSNAVVKIIELNSADKINDYAKNFERYGLKKISVYE